MKPNQTFAKRGRCNPKLLQYLPRKEGLPTCTDENLDGHSLRRLQALHAETEFFLLAVDYFLNGFTQKFASRRVQFQKGQVKHLVREHLNVLRNASSFLIKLQSLFAGKSRQHRAKVPCQKGNVLFSRNLSEQHALAHPVQWAVWLFEYGLKQMVLSASENVRNIVVMLDNRTKLTLEIFAIQDVDFLKFVEKHSYKFAPFGKFRR